MFSTMLLYALAGYFGTPSKFQFLTQPLGDGTGKPDPNGEPKPIKWPWPIPPPVWWLVVVGVVGGLLGGFVVNAGFADNPVLALGGAVIGGRIAYDVMNVVKPSTPRYF